MVEVGEGASAMGSCDLESFARLPGDIAESSVPEVGEDTVGLLVVDGDEEIDLVVHVRVGREKVLPAVVIEIEKAVAPAALRRRQRAEPAGVSRLLEHAISGVLQQRGGLAGEAGED